MENSWTDCAKNEVLHRVQEEKNILHAVKNGRLIALVTSCVGTAVQSTLLKEIQRVGEDEDEGGSSY